MKQNFKQTAQWLSGKNPDMYGNFIATPKTIKCRWEPRSRFVVNPQGQLVKSEGVLYCIEPVEPKDAIIVDGQKYYVLTSVPAIDINGREVHRVVTLG